MCISISWGEAEGEGVVPGFGICMSCCAGDTGWLVGGEPGGFGLADFGPRTADFRFALRFAFRFGAAFGFGFDLLMPGMVWPSCCASTAGAETMQNNTTRDKTVTCLNLENCFFIAHLTT